MKKNPFRHRRPFGLSRAPLLIRGFTLVELMVVIGVIGVLVALVLLAVSRAVATARTMHCQSNLRNIGIALHNYADANGCFPFGVGADVDTTVSTSHSPLHRRYSLHAQLLPYLDAEEVFAQINFEHQPFHAGRTFEPTGLGVNDTAARTTLAVFLCPADRRDRMPLRQWGKNNYRSCNGSSWSGREGNGMFSQLSSVRPGSVIKGLSKTAAFSERIRGDGDRDNVDLRTDVFGWDRIWEEGEFRHWCANLTYAEAKDLRHDSDGGQTWLEGNMNWTRYNHFLPPETISCKGRLSWDGISMPANSRHAGGVNLLMGDGSVRSVSAEIDERPWRELGTIFGGDLNALNL